MIVQIITSERAHGTGLRAARAVAWLLGFGGPWLVPFVIWKNDPHLLAGGGTFSDLPTLWHHLLQLGWESSLHGGSYYYFARPETFQHLLTHPGEITDAYEPERTWAGLRFLERKSARAERALTRVPEVPWNGSAAAP